MWYIFTILYVEIILNVLAIKLTFVLVKYLTNSIFVLHFSVYWDVEGVEDQDWLSNESMLSINSDPKQIGQFVPEKPFPCLQCGRSYKRKASLNSHLLHECGKEPQFQCPHCSYRCKVKSNLVRHFRTFHIVKLRDK